MPDPQLHLRERQVLEGLAGGLTLAGIAAELHITIHTAKAWASRLYETLDVHTQGAAVAAGYRRGLLPLPQLRGWTLQQIAEQLPERAPVEVPDGRA